MDRVATIAWIEELAGAASAMDAIPSDPGARELARVNPTCGDSVRLWFGLDEHGRIRLGGSVSGCSLSTAATVLAIRSLTGQDPGGGRDLIDRAVRHRLTGGWAGTRRRARCARRAGTGAAPPALCGVPVATGRRTADGRTHGVRLRSFGRFAAAST